MIGTSIVIQCKQNRYHVSLFDHKFKPWFYLVLTACYLIMAAELWRHCAVIYIFGTFGWLVALKALTLSVDPTECVQ